MILKKKKTQSLKRQGTDPCLSQTANVGVVAPIIVKNKLIIAKRLYTGKDAHDYVVMDAYQLFAEEGDTYTLTLLQDALNKGDINYDT